LFVGEHQRELLTMMRNCNA